MRTSNSKQSGSKGGVLWRWWKTWHTFPVFPWVKAATLYRSGKFAQAEKFYLKGLRKHENHPASLCARLDLAYCLFKTGQIEQALEQLQLIIRKMNRAREAHLRLAKLQIWSGSALEAAWTIRRSFRNINPDAELLAWLMFAILDYGGLSYLEAEAKSALQGLPEEKRKDPRIQLAELIMSFRKDPNDQALRDQIEKLMGSSKPTIEMIQLYAGILIREGKHANARHHLRRAMVLDSKHPRTLSLLAQLYLQSGPFYSPDFAVQLALSACQNCAWLSAREMHILAEAYYHAGDNFSALAIAERAKHAGTKLLGEYSEVRDLEQLISNLTSGQALASKAKLL